MAAALRSDAAAGRIAPTDNLTDDRAWLFHGTRDAVVGSGVSGALAALYKEFLTPDQVDYVKDVPAAHHFPTDGQGHACDASESPFVGNCGYDAAGELLQFLLIGLKSPHGEAPRELQQVRLDGAAAAGLSDRAYLYVPAGCAESQASCPVHLVLHGCAQSANEVGTAFIEQSGYLPWAEANDIVVAFPQVKPAPMNPYSCWDWWGYTGPDYRWREGAQMKVLASWVNRLSGR